jgi:DNA-binding MarR family transcriptional regulator
MTKANVVSAVVGPELAERTRRVIGSFVRTTRFHTNTLRSARTETLDILAREGALSVAELAARRKVKHQSMRLVVMQLEAAGMLRKESNPSDRRSQLVGLTREGKASVLKGRKARSAWIETALRETFTAKEIACLVTSLEAMERLVEAFPTGHRV